MIAGAGVKFRCPRRQGQNQGCVVAAIGRVEAWQRGRDQRGRHYRAHEGAQQFQTPQCVADCHLYSG